MGSISHRITGYYNKVTGYFLWIYPRCGLCRHCRCEGGYTLLPWFLDHILPRHRTKHTKTNKNKKRKKDRIGGGELASFVVADKSRALSIAETKFDVCLTSNHGCPSKTESKREVGVNLGLQWVLLIQLGKQGRAGCNLG
jgi:hypothetical protein